MSGAGVKELLTGLLPVALILVIVIYFVFRKHSTKTTRVLNLMAGIILLGAIILVNVGDDGAFSDFKIEDALGPAVLGIFIIIFIYLYRRSRRRP